MVVWASEIPRSAIIDHQVSEAQFETGIPADTEDDDLSVEMPPGEQRLDRKEPTHPAMILYRRAVCTRAVIAMENQKNNVARPYCPHCN
jgi:hypothetical protein